MRKVLFLIVMLVAVLTAQASKPVYRGKVLIIGDSTFRYNNFASIFQQIASFNGDSFSVEYILYRDSVYLPFIANSTLTYKLKSTHYDYVIFQETILEILKNTQASFKNGAAYIKSMAQSLGCNHFFLWQNNAYKNGSASLCTKYPICCNYNSMNDGFINLTYNASLDVCSMVPSAKAWALGVSKIGKDAMYQANGVMPSKAGTYLYASLVYDIFRYSWGGGKTYNAFPTGLSLGVEKSLKQISTNSIYTIASYWHNTIPVKDFKFKYSFTLADGKKILLQPIYTQGAKTPYPGLDSSWTLTIKGKPFDYYGPLDSSAIIDTKFKYWIGGGCDTMTYAQKLYYIAAFSPSSGYNIPHSYYNDKNGNCQKEPTEEYITPWSQYSSANYTFFNFPQAGSSDTLNLFMPEDTFNLAFDTSVIKSPACSKNMVISDYTASISHQKIPLSVKGSGKNLSIIGFQRTAWAPGFESGQDIVVYNHGIKTETAYVQMNKPDSLIFVSSTITPSYNSSKTIRWKLILSPGKSIRLTNRFIPSAIVYNNKSILNLQLTCDSIAGDLDSLDNRFTQHLSLSGSWDPNFKEVLNPDALTRFAPIKYLVHFQNTGNGPARRIIIMDTLNKELVPQSFKLMNTSHHVQVWIQNNILQFIFDDINLSDSASNPENSSGYVLFQLNVQREGGSGIYRDTVRNKAHIYFDFNAPVVTNNSKVFAYLSGVKSISSNTHIPWTIYPNPGKNQLMIHRNTKFEKTSYFISDLQGRTLLIKQVGIGEKDVVVDLPEYIPSGVYLVHDIFGNCIRWVRL